MRELTMGVVGGIMLALASVCLAEWPSIDFYTDGVIQDGNTFSVVRTFDDATIDMTGGIIGSRLEFYDTSIFNAYGGELGDGVRFTLFDSSILNLHKIDTFVAYGWPTNLIEAWGPSCEINFYGYGFGFEGDLLHGYWADGSSFAFSIRGNEETQAALEFHEIPEPATISFITVALLIIRKNRPLTL
jgi:hypothetical protein